MTRGRPKKVSADNSTLKLSKSELAKREAEVKALDSFEEIDEKPPSELDYMGKKIYKELIQLMKKDLPVSALDKTTIILFCQSYSIWRKFNKDLETSGMMITIRDEEGNIVSHKVNPAHNALIKTQGELRQLASQLGLTMSSRLALVVPSESEEEDAFLSLIKGG